MFTGIVEELGTVTAFDRRGDTARLTVAAVVARDGSELGASVAVNGVCLTVVDRPSDGLAFEVGPETLRRTALGGLVPPLDAEQEGRRTLRRAGGHRRRQPLQDPRARGVGGEQLVAQPLAQLRGLAVLPRHAGGLQRIAGRGGGHGAAVLAISLFS
jgi:hypothetical protein